MTQDFSPTNMNLFNRIKCTRLIRGFNSFFYSLFFLVFLAVATVLTNIFSLELYFYILIITMAIYVLIFCRDLLPIVPMFLFCYVSPSISNNPADNSASIFSFSGNGKILILMVSLFLIALVIRLTVDKEHGFKVLFTKKRKLSWGILLVAIAFVLSGVGSVGYMSIFKRNILFILLELASLFLLYFLFTATVDWKYVNYEYFGYMGMLWGLTVFVELINIYRLNFEVIKKSGKYSKIFLVQGWGKSNNIACVLAISVPCTMILAVKKRFGFLALIVSTVLLLSVFFTLSRASILFGCMIFGVGFIILMIKSKHRISLIITAVIILLVALTVFLIYKQKFIEIIGKFYRDFTSDNSRFEIYNKGFADYRNSPVFGGSFYLTDYSQRLWGNEQIDNVLPPLLHNTIIQIMASCGAVGLFSYIFHRYQTIKMMFVKPNTQKTFIGLSIAVLLLTSLLDCHLFNLGPGLFYAIALAFAEKEQDNLL